MIAGIGVDLVTIERIQALLIKYGDAFSQRILSEQEFSHWQQRLQNSTSIEMNASKLAKYWAAKEATSKAFGTGFSNGIHWRDICLCYEANGKPSLYFTGGANQWVKKQGIQHAHISFSDEKTLVIAMVVLEK